MSQVLELQWRWGDDVLAVQHHRNVDAAVLQPSRTLADAWIRSRTAYVPVTSETEPVHLRPGDQRTLLVGGLTLWVGWVDAHRAVAGRPGNVDVLWAQAVGAVAGMAVMLAGLVNVLPAPPPEPETPRVLKTAIRLLLEQRKPPRPQRQGGARPQTRGTVGQAHARAPQAPRPRGVTRVDAATRAHNVAAARGAGVLALLRNSGAVGRVMASDLGGDIENSLGSLTRGDATVQVGSGGVTSRGHGPGGGGNVPLGLGQLGTGTGRGPGGPDDVDLGRHVKVTMPTQGCVDCLMGGDALSRTEVERVVRRHLAQISYCYEKELPRNPNLAGKIVAQWTIAPGGNTVGVGSNADTMGDDAVASCVHKVIARMRFPQPRGGNTVEVNYPFVFQQAGN